MQQRRHSPGFILISGPRNVTQVAYLIFKRNENPHFSDSYVNMSPTARNGPFVCI